MKKMRVFELSKDLDIEPKDLLKIAKDLAISVENTMSLLDTHDIERIKKRIEKIKQDDSDQQVVPDEEYVERRIAPNVIRRRAKMVPSATQPPVAKRPSEDHKKEEKEHKELEEVVSEEGPVKEVAKAGKEVRAEESKRPEEAEEERLEVEEAASTGEGLEAERAEQGPKKVVPSEKVGETEKKETEEKLKKKEKKKGKQKNEEGVLVEEKPGGVPEHKPKKKRFKKEKQVFSGRDLYDASRGRAYARRARKGKQKKVPEPEAYLPVKKKLKIGHHAIMVGNLAREMRLKVSEVIKVLMNLGITASQNQYIEAEDAMIVASELGYEVDAIRDEIKEDILALPEYNPADLAPRPPVVTVMGHVDHGKTSLLDAIKKTNITESEYGGITQHIGAYQVVFNGRPITFIDTPGHEAFTAMRARGAQVTDFVVLVVAADDGVMDQTKEAINHARNAKVPLLVAINKIDKPNANLQLVKKQLSEQGLVPEDWGGDTIFVDVSAKKHIGIENLLEMIVLQADMLGIKACPKGKARGVVLEARIDKSRGPVCTVLVQNGTLKRGDAFVVGMQWGKARAMFDFESRKTKEAKPGTPVEILGLNDIPSAGDKLIVVSNEKKAKEVIAYLREEKRFKAKGEETGTVTLEDLYDRVQKGQANKLNLVVKADVHGSAEAIANAATGIDAGDKLKVEVIHSAVGGITENDILLASTAGAIVIGFNVRPEARARAIAKRYGVEIKLYTVIYDLINDIKQALKGRLEPEYLEVSLGRAEVREVFRIPKVGIVSGCMVLAGKLLRGTLARLVRDNAVVYEGKIKSLRRFKEDVAEVAQGYECGIGLENYNDVKAGDIIEVYTKEEQEIEI